ncbi:hypothetical protein HYV57_05430 [Candidatus Peregrinibacteria bacterium]|nr:hypothetical protein [Candidatus Peregrinibacteria bacterium]
MFEMKRFGKIVLLGFLYAILAQVVHSVSALFSMGYYTLGTTREVWSVIMMPSFGPPPPVFFVVSFFFSMVIGIVLAFVYSIIHTSLHGTVSEKGMCFGILIFLISGISSGFSTFLLFNVPLMLIWVWAIEAFVISIFGGMIIARVYHK